jgi:hypothetical protein
MKLTKMSRRVLVAVVAAGVAIPLTAVGASASTYSGGKVSCSRAAVVIEHGSGQGTINFKAKESNGLWLNHWDDATNSLPRAASWNTRLTYAGAWQVYGSYVNGGSAACSG